MDTCRRLPTQTFLGNPAAPAHVFTPAAADREREQPCGAASDLACQAQPGRVHIHAQQQSVSRAQVPPATALVATKGTGWPVVFSRGGWALQALVSGVLQFFSRALMHGSICSTITSVYCWICVAGHLLTGRQWLGIPCSCHECPRLADKLRLLACHSQIGLHAHAHACCSLACSNAALTHRQGRGHILFGGVDGDAARHTGVALLLGPPGLRHTLSGQRRPGLGHVAVYTAHLVKETSTGRCSICIASCSIILSCSLGQTKLEQAPAAARWKCHRLAPS